MEILECSRNILQLFCCMNIYFIVNLMGNVMVVPLDAFPPQAVDMERRCSKCSGEGIGRMRVGADSQSVAQQPLA